MKLYVISSALIALVIHTLPLSANSDRWYSDAQVKQGKNLFSENCAVCHGKNAEATKDWKKRDANGNLVPPPLNGTAHTWHHPFNILKQTIKKGGAAVGGTMPSFGEKLTDAQIEAIIAWFQSKWSDEIYSAWNKRNKQQEIQPVKQAKESPKDSITELLRKRLRGVEVGPAQATLIEGLYHASIGSDVAYLLSNGRYALVGELIDLKTGENLTELTKSKDKLRLLKSFPESDMVIFKAEGKTRHTITILTDTDCPFCRKLHKDIPELQKAGITIRYIAFPRNGKQGINYNTMRSVWCAKDREKAMSIAKGAIDGELDKGTCKAGDAVDRGFEFGLKIGLRGTPAIILPNGKMIEGYVKADKLIQMIKSNQ